MKYIIMDLEWNQPMCDQHLIREPVILRGEIIQIGAVKLSESFQVEGEFKQLVMPRYYTRMHYRVAKLTGIKNADLKGGIPFPDAWKCFSEWCGEEYAFLTWGLDDIPMLKNNLILHAMDPNEIPAHYNVQILFARQIAKENRQFSLQAAAAMVEETPEAAHDALNDAVSTARICRHLDMEDGITHYADGKLSFPTPNNVKLYGSKAEALRDAEVHSFQDEESGEMARCGRFVSQKHDRYIAIAQTPSGQRHFVRLRFRKTKDGYFRVGRSICPLDEAMEKLYESLREAQKRSNHRQYRSRQLKTSTESETAQ